MAARAPKKLSALDTHPILKRAKAVLSTCVTEEEAQAAPHDRQEFLDWWWKELGGPCTRCVLSTTRCQTVKPDGRVDHGRPMVLVVGEGPGEMENFTGLPLVGPMELRGSRCGHCQLVGGCYSHKMLYRLDGRHPRKKTIVCAPQIGPDALLTQKFYLQSAGSIVDAVLMKAWNMSYPRQNWLDYYNELHVDAPWVHHSPWFFTNSILCRSFDTQLNKDKEPGTIPKRECKKWLIWQWAAVQPRVTILLGVPALEAMVSNKAQRAGIIAGEPFEHPKLGTMIFQSHPARMMREENEATQALMFAKLGETFRRALDLCGYPTV